MQLLTLRQPRYSAMLKTMLTAQLPVIASPLSVFCTTALRDTQNHPPPPQPPTTTTNKGMMPSYAQATMTTYADFIYRGSLVAADENTTFARALPDTAQLSPLLWAGAPNILCIARALDAVDGVYLVVLSVQRLSNAKSNLQKTTVSSTVSLPGFKSPIQLSARLQGAVYVVRNDTNASRLPPIVYQLDKLHLPSHPLYWPTDTAVLEAELLEGHLGISVDHGIIVTERADGADANDWTEFDTYVDLGRAAATNRAVVHAHPDESRGTCTAIRARVRKGTGGTPATISIEIHSASVVEVRRFANREAKAKSWEWVEWNLDAQEQSCHRIRVLGRAQLDKLEIIF